MYKHSSTKHIQHQKGLLTNSKTIQGTKNQFPGIKQTFLITCTYKTSRQVPKNGYQTATTIQTNLAPLEAWTKNIATKMAGSEFWNKNKKSKARLTNQNTRKMN